MRPEARYRSDDRDLPGSDNDLVIFFGGNGDWYVSIVKHGERIGPAARVTTSGVPRGFEGVAPAVARLHAALRGDRSGERFLCPDCGLGVKADEDGCCASCGRDCAIVVVLVEPLDMEPSAGSPAGGRRDLAALQGKVVELVPGEGGSEVMRVEVEFLTRSPTQRMLLGQQVSVVVEMPPDPALVRNVDGLTPYRQSRADAGHCMSNRDGECDWAKCPQNRDGEPGRTGRHCPRDVQQEDEA
jgi:hypothetical protein